MIYDQDASARRPIQNYWQAVSVVDVIKQDQIADMSGIPDHIQQTLNLNFGATDSATGANIVDQEEFKLKWRLQGFKLFKVRFY